MPVIVRLQVAGLVELWHDVHRQFLQHLLHHHYWSIGSRLSDLSLMGPEGHRK
jgi:hypothetical protein